MQQKDAFPSKLLTSVVMLGLCNSVTADDNDYAEFNASFFGSDDETVANIERFNTADYIPAGNYDVDIFVNGKLKGRKDVQYVEAGNNQTSLCLTPALVDVFDLKPGAFATKEKGECQNVTSYIPDAKLQLDQGTLALKMDIPQALTIVRPRGYIAPALWEDGVPSMFTNYSLTQFRHYQNGNRYRSEYAYINGGINAYGWALRHNGSWYRTIGSGGHYTRGVTYLQRGIASLNSQLTIGDITTNGAITDSVSMRGISLGTDLRMLPQTQRGYAPKVIGTANNNAVVIIRQNGNIIYQTDVPAGPFEINDLYPTGHSGELDVEVHESDGRVQNFKVPYATLVPLMRMGQLKYEIAAGRYRYGNKVLNENVVSGSLQYGLENNVTVNTGFIAHRNYFSGSAGIAFNTPLGAFSADITQAIAKFHDGTPMPRGSAIRGSYSLYFDETKTNITLATYRYFSRNYYSLDETVWANQINQTDGREELDKWRKLSPRPKNRYQLTMSQNLGDKWGSFYFTGAINNYWNSSSKTLDYQFAYSNTIKEINYHLSFSQSRVISSGKSDKQVGFNISMPFPFTPKHTERKLQGYFTHTTTLRNNGEHVFRNTYSQSLGEYSQFNYGISASKTRKGVSTGTLSANYRTGMGTFDASVSRDSRHNTQYKFGVNGAVVVHPKGITLSDTLGHTFAIVHAENGRGARLNNGLGKKLDYFGNAIVEYLTPYEYNRVGIDPTDLPINLEFDATEREFVPKANTSSLINLKSQRNTMVLFDLEHLGKEIPLGAEAFDSKGASVGFVAQGGALFANRLSKEQDRIKVQWGGGEDEACYFNYNTINLNGDGNDLARYSATCSR